MTYAGEHIVSAIKTARKAKGLSQRDLSARAHVPQSHISRIESGAVDLKLSSLIELARVLDLEVMLAPRKLVPAVQSVVRSGEASALRTNDKKAANELQRLQEIASRMQHIIPNSAQLEQLQKAVSVATNFKIDPAHYEAIRRATESMSRAMVNPETQKMMEAVRRAAESMQTVRNQLVHALPTPAQRPRPAYTLDDGDNDA